MAMHFGSGFGTNSNDVMLKKLQQELKEHQEMMKLKKFSSIQSITDAEKLWNQNVGAKWQNGEIITTTSNPNNMSISGNNFYLPRITTSGRVSAAAFFKEEAAAFFKEELDMDGNFIERPLPEELELVLKRLYPSISQSERDERLDRALKSNYLRVKIQEMRSEQKSAKEITDFLESVL
jgi:hypothetical protein